MCLWIYIKDFAFVFFTMRTCHFDFLTYLESSVILSFHIIFTYRRETKTYHYCAFFDPEKGKFASLPKYIKSTSKKLGKYPLLQFCYSKNSEYSGEATCL